jgi:hypothetical protein
MEIPGNPLDKKNYNNTNKRRCDLILGTDWKKQGRTNAFHDNIFLYLTSKYALSFHFLNILFCEFNNITIWWLIRFSYHSCQLHLVFFTNIMENAGKLYIYELYYRNQVEF